MSEPDDKFVKRGFWINWEQGPVMGRTITVDSRTGNVIIALLTILASVASAQLWNLVTFFYHQHRAKGTPADGLFWQQQVLLRTLPTPTSLMADTVKLWWAWRTKADRPLWRSTLPFFTAVLFAIAALAAGISTSYVVDTSNIEILVDSPYCRQINLTTFFLGARSGINPNWEKLNKMVETYTLNCYGNTSDIPAVCKNTFTKPRITFKKEPAPCPWNSTMCLRGDTPAIAMDSGLLDMNKWFGINLQKKDGVRYRKRTTCNPLPLDGHYDIMPMSDLEKIMVDPPRLGEEALGVRLGRMDFPEDEFPEYPYIQNLAQSNYTEQFTGRARIDYARPDEALATNSYIAMPEMTRADADTVVGVVWLNSVHYDAPVEDPLFASHKTTYSLFNGRNLTRYHPDQPFGAIGCSEQYQFCLAQSGKEDFCTDLTSLPLTPTQADFPTASDIQLAVMRLLRWLSAFNDISNGLILKLIDANDIVSTPNRREIPSDQWINEITFWQSYVYAGLQTMLADVAVGPIRRDADADQYTDPPITPGEKMLCKSMKMRKSGGFSNINVFGLAFITTFSTVITLLNLMILRFVLWMSKFRRALAPRIERWAQDGLFQLQRRAFDAHGEGTWAGLEKEIPSTSPKQILEELPIESLPIWRPKHINKKYGDDEKRFDDFDEKKGDDEQEFEPKPLTRVFSDGETLHNVDTQSSWGKGKEEFGKPKRTLTESSGPQSSIDDEIQSISNENRNT
ncbi:hypothetical protein CC78DRAFT_570714 [Lojkania enalia]|uniref:Uncharacterized protein n=1 Tax=Lojkania enalia TaxID=147567 RepID=A0A9P4N133_9PLEO|nr:hypothetical protein CC78DRAFT_570714 [Didymosphaeria enalia]